MIPPRGASSVKEYQTTPPVSPKKKSSSWGDKDAGRKSSAFSRKAQLYLYIVKSNSAEISAILCLSHDILTFFNFSYPELHLNHVQCWQNYVRILKSRSRSRLCLVVLFQYNTGPWTYRMALSTVTSIERRNCHSWKRNSWRIWLDFQSDVI